MSALNSSPLVAVALVAVAVVAMPAVPAATLALLVGVAVAVLGQRAVLLLLRRLGGKAGVARPTVKETDRGSDREQCSGM